ncbi:hypothetical protein GCM10023149_16300 [Mucilaginibacter gynuensis]|uniref:Bacterial surface antigen (D15) domain-containing protein n=1 Tax=Mucilaginibacter gynuensis TaxID=1302236 RepID=A0ABP8G6J7_9SPHI
MKASEDSTIVAIHPAYDNVSGVHRWLFGENFRKEWAMPVKLPVIRISQWNGGLQPVKQGGGMQSTSLRLKDANGKEWVLRSVEKIPDKLVPAGMLGTFAVDWVGDEFSAQHPYSALIVPPLAEAVGVPHTDPVIGVVADDPALGEYKKKFAGMVCLLEEREPVGHSESTFKTEEKLIKTYDNRLDGEVMLKARLLDLLIGDWDRHEDQWRFKDSVNGSQTMFIPVPRDRDQVLHVTQGLFPLLASVSWLDPVLGDFNGEIPRVKWSLYKTRFIKSFPDQQFSYAKWMHITDEFIKAESDSVLEAGLKRLPAATYIFRHAELLQKLKMRRDHLHEAMAEYYRFINRIADLRTTSKSENILITDASDGGLDVKIVKAPKSDQTDDLWNIHYDPKITHELRLYTSGGADQVKINAPISPIKLRIIDSTGINTIGIVATKRPIRIYAPMPGTKISGLTGRAITHFSNDTLNNRFVPTDLYNIWMPIVSAAINADDGFLLGLGFRYKGVDGFRKGAYSNIQSLMLSHSFETDAFRIQYQGEWIRSAGSADIVLKADLMGPDNKMNFFSRGNETRIDRSGDYHRYYRTRLDLYTLDPALRLHVGKGHTLMAGPSLQYYHFNTDINDNRFINTPNALRNSFDSTTYRHDKVHLGLKFDYTNNQRNNEILPSAGYLLTVNLSGFKGLNSSADSYGQLTPEFTYYQSLNASGTFVLSDRVGGGITVGKPAYYQSLYLGGQGNLLGYHKYRFAGQNAFYNNLQARFKLTDIASYIVRGQLGITSFYDVGRVWVKGESSDKWHQGTGGGIYFCPAGLTVIQALAGYSNEGWYPYISMNFRL